MNRPQILDIKKAVLWLMLLWHAQVIAAATAAAVELGASHKRMVSRAYHDSLFMSQVPAAPADITVFCHWAGW